MPRQNTKLATYQQALRSEYERRKTNLPKYTVRKFARDIGISPATVVTVLSGKSHFRLITALKVAKQLHWTDSSISSMVVEIEQLKAEQKQQRGDKQRTPILLEQFYYLISDWRLMAIAHLAGLPENHCDPQWIAARLNIPVSAARTCLSSLEDRGIIQSVHGKMELQGSLDPFIVSNSVKPALRYQQALLKRAADSLEHTPEDQHMSLIRMLPIDADDLPRFESMIWSFYKKFEKKAAASRLNQLYCLAVQFFPISTRG